MNCRDDKVSVIVSRKRIRTGSLSSTSSKRLKNEERTDVQRSKFRTFEGKYNSAVEKNTAAKIMKTKTYQRFYRSIVRIFEVVEGIEILDEVIKTFDEEGIESFDEEGIETLDKEGIETLDEEYSEEALIPTCQLQELCAEAAKVKKLGGIEYIPKHKVIKLLAILDRNILDGAELYRTADCSCDKVENESSVSSCMERTSRAIAASLTALYIFTAPNIHKQIYLEDVIDRIFVFSKVLLNHTYNAVYKTQTNEKDRRIEQDCKKVTYCKHVCSKSTVIAYFTKLTEVISLLAELINIQRLTDNSILHASSLGVSAFLVESECDLQLAALKLITNTFTKYEKHRKLLLDDILASLARLPTSKRRLRMYRLANGEHIQMLTALVLQLIQSIVILPESNYSQAEANLMMINKYKIARTITSNFLYVFLTKCTQKSSEIDYRPVLDNFVQDLLTAVYKPELPAAELMLSVLGQLLVKNLIKKSEELPLRLVSLDYLSIVVPHLRKGTVLSQVEQDTIDQLISDLQLQEIKDDKGISIGEINGLMDDERIQFLQRVLIDYLTMKGKTESMIGHARHFYLAQWYQYYCNKKSTPTVSKQWCKKSKRKKKQLSHVNSSTEEEVISSDHPTEINRSNDVENKFLLPKILTGESNILKTQVSYSSAKLISKFLASKRPVTQNFDVLLKQILKVLSETSVPIRIKAMKCLASIVEVDASVLGMKEVQLGVSVSFLDQSTLVRESAVDLVGKFILCQPELISKYYDMLTSRILDTGVSVRKKVIKIFKHLCIKYPNFEKIPEICLKIIRRIDDEEDSIRKLVLEVFQNMWFTPVKEKAAFDSDTLTRNVQIIIDVVALSNDASIRFIEHLLMNLFKQIDHEDGQVDNTQTPQVSCLMLTACRQIVDCLVQTAARLAEGIANEATQRLASCLTMVHVVAKIKPELVVQHVTAIAHYLFLKCRSHGESQIISCVARTLELVVPLMKQPSKTFLSSLEERLVKLMIQQHPSGVQSCLSCLAKIVNNFTRNYPLIRDCFKIYFTSLNSFKQTLESSLLPSEEVKKLYPEFRRSLFVVGLLLRFFDFTKKEVTGDDIPETIKDDVFNLFIHFLNCEQDSQHYVLKAIGFICIRHYELMTDMKVRVLYQKYLKDEHVPILTRIQVLNNIETYLQEEERKLIKQDQEWNKSSKKEDLKVMGDLKTGMASTIIQLYLKEILEALFHPHSSVRISVLRVIQLVLDQGLVYPGQIVPYLIAMSSDEKKAISSAADLKLEDINKKHPGFVHMMAQYGLHLSYKLQRIIKFNVDIVRGLRLKEGEPLPSALNGSLYYILGKKPQRRALVLSMLKQFQEHAETNLPKMLYLADNMAHFPYKVQDEPLFIIHHIDTILSLTGANLIQSFREALIPQESSEEENNNAIKYEDEDEESLLRRVPADTIVLQQCIASFQGCILLLLLKEHLKTLYGFTEAKIRLYSPSDSTKAFEKSAIKKTNSVFNPKITLKKLRKSFSPSELNKEVRRSLISEYFEFKTLLMDLDTNDKDGSYNGT